MRALPVSSRVATTRHKAGAYGAASSAEVSQLIGILFVAILVLPTCVERPLAVRHICDTRSPSFFHALNHVPFLLEEAVVRS